MCTHQRAFDFTAPAPIVAADWNPYYLAYCRAEGTPHPDEMLARDRVRYPGGKMAGFIVWIHEQWGAWQRATARRDLESLSTQDRAAFEAWLEERHG